MSAEAHDGLALAVVGLAGRFPGAADVRAFWRNLVDGVCSVRRYDERELLAAGVERATLRDPAFVPAGAELPDVDAFDAAFFEIGPREAEALDPQHRLFLECCHAALEDAACDPRRFDGPIGVYAAPGLHHYMWTRFFAGQGTPMEEHLLQIGLGHALPTRVSYKLDLRGPSLALQTGCSSSLVAIHAACQALLAYECDLALAGGVSVMPFQKGYFRQDGALSGSGVCRPFDAEADGLVAGNGLGVVALMRLADARAAGHHVYALVRGSAVNNDGAEKAGFVAPSVQGQTRAITTAQAAAGVAADTIGYVETHGTGTPLGDSIELTALERVFRAGGARPRACALGSVKANIGHLDSAAGVAAFIKATLAVHHGVIPPLVNLRRPNPGVDWEQSAFYVPLASAPWEAPVRRAAVSAFGIGGTNAHVVLEGAPAAPAAAAEPPAPRLLLLSARTPAALDARSLDLARHLEAQPGPDLADVAFTLHVGRTGWEERRFVVAAEASEAARALSAPAAAATRETRLPGDASVVFLFPGAGSAEAVGAGLYAHEQVFRDAYDACAEGFREALGHDPRRALQTGVPETSAASLADLFAFEYALARVWRAWGVTPAAYAGHSVGEYVAATLAGVFTLPDAVRLVALRARLFERLPEGAMLSVPLPEPELLSLLQDGVGLAAVNGPERCVVSGPVSAVEQLERSLRARRVGCTRLAVRRAGHSSMLDPFLREFEDELRRTPRAAPQAPFVSNLSGTWITPEQAVDAAYWTEHLRRPVRWADGLRTLLEADGRVLLEVGPDQSLTQLVRRQLRDPRAQRALASFGRPDDAEDRVRLLSALGRLWLAGVAVDWSAFHSRAARRRLPLPTYPFERQRFWGGPQPPGAWPAPLDAGVGGARALRPGGSYLVCADEPAAGDALAQVVDQIGGRALRLRHVRPQGVSLEREAPFVAEREQALAAELDIRGVESYPGLREDLLDVCRASAFASLGPALGQGCELEELRARLGVRPEFVAFCDYLVEFLVGQGWVERTGSRLGPGPRRAPADPQQTARAAAQRQPGFARVFGLVAHCASHYARVFRGEMAANAVLYPDGRYDLLEDLARHTVETSQERRYRRLAAETLARLAQRAERPLRVLEVGAGTGLLTREVFDALPPERLRYTFTDIGRSFVQAARRHADQGAWPPLSAAVLDVARDPRAQGFAEAAYDVVLGLNVVQATKDVGGALRHLRTLLAPGGVLALLQSLRDEPWMHLVFGLSPGWWNFVEDPRRGRSPVLSLAQWDALVREAGFDEAHSFPGGAARASAEFGLVLARAPLAWPGSPAPADVLTVVEPAEAGSLAERAGVLDGLLVWEPAGPDRERLAALERLLGDAVPGGALVVSDGGPALPSGERAALVSPLRAADLRFAWTAVHLPPRAGGEGPDAGELADFLGRSPGAARAALVLPASPQRPQAAAEGRESAAEPAWASDVERRVALLFGELLGRSQVLPQDDFFECGGDSLQALQLVARLRDAFQVDVPVKALFQGGSVRALAERLAAGAGVVEKEAAERDPAPIPVRPRGHVDLAAALAQVESLALDREDGGAR